MISRASSNRAKILSSGSPNARAWPGHSCPAPSPKTNRPPLISSSVSTVLAMIPGFRCNADMTHVPTFARDVTAATAPAIETPSQAPRGGPSSVCQSSSSGVQIVSKPISSARRA